MPSTDEILAQLDAADDLDEGSTTESDESTSNAIKKVRDWGKGQEKARKDAEKELKELREFKAQVETQARTQEVEKVFTDLGLSPKQAKLFLKVNEGDTSGEAVKQFLVDYDLAPADLEDAPAPTGAPEGFEPGAPGNIQSTDPAKRQLNQEEAEALRIKDPDAYVRAAAAGKVPLLS